MIRLGMKALAPLGQRLRHVREIHPGRNIYLDTQRALELRADCYFVIGHRTRHISRAEALDIMSDMRATSRGRR